MGHRHVFDPSYMFETDNDQRWNFIEHHYSLMESGGAESSSLAYPANNMSIDGEQCSDPSLAHSVQNLHHQQDTSGPLDLPTGHENYGDIASSSTCNAHPNHEDDNGRWNYKRKSPADTSIYNNDDDNGGSSSEFCIPTDLWEESQSIDFFTPWDYRNMKPVHEGESSVRNVRSRAAPNDYYTSSHSMDVSGSLREWDPTHVSSSLQSNELNPFLNGSTNSSENGIITRTNHVQTIQEQSIIGTRNNNYIQRSSVQLGHSHEELQLPTENFSSPHVRPTIAWCSSERNARTRITIGRCQSYSEAVSFHSRPMPEGLMIVDRSTFGSRNPFDYHQNMRLDIDDMSYEELLALGERIGSVNTGLSENLISKCLKESIYSSCSDQIQKEEGGACVICLEEYAKMDEVGMLKGCKHDFHVGCIKKWLSMKNMCPICKSEPIKQDK